ncbi:MAG: dihydroorotate dehydrogenase-like protein [Thermoflexaceae bacterium]|nr:dihydroorotate dehydrogenase-like protein [Thermoflexaceae bacterium]
MVDMTTRYLGLTLPSPVAASASPLSDSIDTLRRLEAAGAGAVVLRSLFEEQIVHESLDLHELLEQWTESYLEAQSFFPALPEHATRPAAYLDAIEQARRELSIPVIASLNGITPGGWTRYARQIEEAGAHAIELNVYFVAANATETAESVEERYATIVAAVRDVVRIPVAVKLSPFFSALPSVARRLVACGADGLVLFNRFMQPDIDLESLTVVPTVRLSSPAELALPIRWIAILRGCGVDVSLAATSGVHASEDVLKALLAGADVTMMASALLIHGPEHLATVVAGVEQWMRDRHYDSVRQMVGSLSHATSPDPAAFERSNYMKALVSYSGAPAQPWAG